MPCTIFIDLFKAVGRGRRFWFFGFNSPSTTFPFLPSEPPSQRFIFRNYGRVAVVQPIIVKEVVCIPLCVETCRINPLELVWNESDDIPILTAQNLLHWLVRGIFRHWWVARYTAVVIHESNQLYIIREIIKPEQKHPVHSRMLDSLHLQRGLHLVSAWDTVSL